jgi:transcriptional regulator with XRE-family HTH domain
MNAPVDIAAFRKSRNWTKVRMADELGVDVSTVWRWENWGGPKKGPVVKAIERLADEFPPAAERAQ